ncbi:MAG: hypothetical protein WCV84_00935 [Patescibacteria group bacterium]
MLVIYGRFRTTEVIVMTGETKISDLTMLGYLVLLTLTTKDTTFNFAGMKKWLAEQANWQTHGEQLNNEIFRLLELGWVDYVGGVFRISQTGQHALIQYKAFAYISDLRHVLPARVPGMDEAGA